MTTKERINQLFNKFNVNLTASEDVEISLEIQAILDNGTVIYTDAENWIEGVDAYILNDEGERIPLPEGDYVLEDGSVLSVGEGGKVKAAPISPGGEGVDSEGGEGGQAAPSASGNPPKGGKAPKAPAKPPAKKAKKSAQEKLAVVDVEEEVDEDGEKKEEVEVEAMDETFVRALINEILDARFPDGAIAEDVVEEEELSETEKLERQVKLMTEEIQELKLNSAPKGVKRQISTAKKVEAVDLSTLNTEERVKALFNKFNR